VQGSIAVDAVQVAEEVVEPFAGQAVLSVDAGRDARFNASESIRHLRLHSIMCAPMIAEFTPIAQRGAVIAIFGRDLHPGRNYCPHVSGSLIEGAATVREWVPEGLYGQRRRPDRRRDRRAVADVAGRGSPTHPPAPDGRGSDRRNARRLTARQASAIWGAATLSP